MSDDRRPPHKTTAPTRKPPIGLIPMRALVGTARVMEAGNVGRAPGNFVEIPLADGVRAFDDAFARHRLSMQPLSGVVTPASLAAIDPDSGLPAIDHLIANLLILRTLMIRDNVLAEDPQVTEQYTPIQQNICASLPSRLIDPSVRCDKVTGTGLRCIKAAGHDVPGSAERSYLGYLHQDSNGITSKD